MVYCVFVYVAAVGGAATAQWVMGTPRGGLKRKS